MSPIRNKNRNAGLDKGLYLVDRIIDDRITNDGKLLYLIKWKGYSSNNNTWEPKENVTAVCIEKYEQRKTDSGKNKRKTEEPLENEKENSSQRPSSTSVPPKKVKSFSARLLATMAKYEKVSNIYISKSNSSEMTSNPSDITSTRKNSTSPELGRSNVTLVCIGNEGSVLGMELEVIEESAFYKGQQVFLVKFKNQQEYCFMTSELMTKLFPIQVIQFYESRIVPIKGENKLNEIFGDRLLDWKHVVPRGVIYRHP